MRTMQNVARSSAVTDRRIIKSFTWGESRRLLHEKDNTSWDRCLHASGVIDTRGARTCRL